MKDWDICRIDESTAMLLSRIFDALGRKFESESRVSVTLISGSYREAHQEEWHISSRPALICPVIVLCRADRVFLPSGQNDESVYTDNCQCNEHIKVVIG